MKYLVPTPAATPAVPTTPTPGVPGAPVAAVNQQEAAHSIWPLGTDLSLSVYVTASPDVMAVFSPKKQDDVLTHFTWDNIKYGDWKEQRTWDGSLTLPASVRNNQSSLWAHLFLATNGASPDPYNAKFDSKSIHHIRRHLTRYMPRKKVVVQKNLLSKSDELEVEEVEEIIDPKDSLLVPNWYTNITLALVSDIPPVAYRQLPAPMAEHIHIAAGEQHAHGDAYYYPIVYPNTFWQLSSHWTPYSSANITLPLHIDFHALSYLKFQIYSSLAAGFESAATQNGPTAGAEMDEIKRMLIETNPWLLIVTAIVSVLHMVFEFLAFTADVGHWRKKSELVGVSVRTIITNVFVQLVIMLYLVDNNSETSWMILFGQGTGVLIEAWKVTKVLDIKVVPSAPGATLPYRLDIQDKHVLTADEKLTQEYDKLAFRYVSYVAAPLLGGYTIYSLIYDTHKGWYSFIISTLTSFVYAFGFAQLVPQLIINYKLKSVAHLPTKAFVYKFLGTIVDDFFAFCIKMPFLHRLACFRDDVVFLIFLYQRWIYRVDKKRVNEFGQVAGDETETAKDGSVVESKKDK